MQAAWLIYTVAMTQAYGRTDSERGVSRFHVTLGHYHAMIEAGLLEGKRVQLIKGELLEMTPMGPPHIGRITILTMQLVASLRGRAAVSSQTPISLETKDTEPEADFVILSLEVFQESQFENRLPRAREVSALVEVSDSSLAFDRGEKLTLYAENGVKEVWILVVKTGRLEVYRNPRDGAYLEKRTLESGESARFLDYPDVFCNMASMNVSLYPSGSEVNYAYCKRFGVGGTVHFICSSGRCFESA